MSCLWPLERGLSLAERKTTPCCFIIGPPRSGTTLVYEALVRSFKFAYISNLAHRFYYTPLAATWIGKPLIHAWLKRIPDSYESRYGHIKGWGAPNEGGWVWNRFLPQTHYLEAEVASKIHADELQSIVNGLSTLMGGPFLNKNVMHSVHLHVLNILFPNSLFIEIRRDIRDNVRSIFRAMKDPVNTAEPSEWFSVKPRVWERYQAADFLEQSVAEVVHIQKDIADQRQSLGSERFLIIQYEDFCRNMQDSLENIYCFLERFSIPLQKVNVTIPSTRPVSEKKLSEDIESRMTKLIEQMESEFQ
jgi:hypothetical protein